MKMYILIIVLLLFNLVALPQKQYKYSKSLTNNVIFKIKYQCRQDFNEKNNNNITLQEYFNKNKYHKKFPLKTALSKQKRRKNTNLVDLSLIYVIELGSFDKCNSFIKEIYKEDIVEYAVFEHINELEYIPNDDAYTSQYYLNNLKVFDAWDISKGDSTIIIGIVDTGIDIDHEDLNKNIYRNENDPIDGLDNDQDGYIDNYWGWDLADNDNNPQWDSSGASSAPHGVWVSGCASAVADNGIGLAGVGYRTKIMPVKVSTAQSTSITRGYEGIVYAADHGCDIINCSWGSTIGDEYGQDIINYAVFNRNALVVSAAGNNGMNLAYYPASYDNTMNIGGTNVDDLKWNNSNYSVSVDCMAPGESVRMTAPHNHYINGWGTSFASPIFAGCAAIVKSYYDTLSALQIGEVLRTTCDNIDTIPGNEPYANFMGTGRVNLYRALSDEIKSSVRYKNVNYIIENDTMKITGNFVNYLNSTNNLNVLLTTNSPYMQLINNSFVAGQIQTMDTVSNNNSAFTILVDTNTPMDEDVYFKLIFSDGNYNDFQMLHFALNQSYVDIDTNNITTTITNNGLIAYTETRKGTGFNYKNYKDICYEMGIIIGLDTNIIENCVRGDTDFVGYGKAIKFSDDTLAHQIIKTTYLNLDSSEFNVTINQTIYAWNDEEYKDFIFVEYQIINNIDTIINNLNFGIFADWDIINYSLNKADFYKSSKLAYVYSSSTEQLYAGFQLLSDTIMKAYAIDNINGGEGGVDITDGFSDEEKYFVLTHKRQMAGVNGLGNDVCHALSCGGYNINPYDTIQIVYAIHSAENINNLITNANSAQVLYDSLFPKPVGIKNIVQTTNLFYIYPNPAKNNLQIIIRNSQIKNDFIEIYNIAGVIVKQIAIKQSNDITININDLQNGIYFVRIDNNILKFVKN